MVSELQQTGTFDVRDASVAVPSGLLALGLLLPR
jgi:hypothetical protein